MDQRSGLNGLEKYLADRDAERAASIHRRWSALTPREQALVREASVMGFVQGAMYGSDKRCPKDSVVVSTVLGAVASHSDLYPTLSDDA